MDAVIKEKLDSPTKHAALANWILVISLVYAAISRAAYLIWDSHNSPFFRAPISDALMYHDRALAMMHGHWYVGHAFYQAPLYPYFLGFVYSIFGSGPWPIHIIQGLIGLGNILLIQRIARFLLPPVWASISAAIAALYFGFAFYESFLLLETLGLNMLLWGLFFTLRAQRSNRIRPWLPAGLAIGLACLARPNALLLLPLVSAWILLSERKHFKASLASVAVLLVGAAIAIAPATIHNWAAEHKFVLVTSNAGATLLFGNNPGASGTLSLPPGFSGNIRTQRQEEVSVAEKLLKRPLTHDQAAHYWLKRTLEFLANHPAFTLHLEYLKFRRFLNHVEYPDNYSIRFDPNPFKILMPIPFGIILALSVWGIVKSDLKSPGVQIPLLFLLIPFLTVMIFYMTARYRLPALPILIIFAGAGVRALLSVVKSKAWTSVAIATYVIAFALYVSYKPMKQWDSAASWDVRRGVAWLELKQPNRALEQFASARKVNPKERGLWLNTALAYYRLDLLPQALNAANRAVRIDSEAVKPLAMGLKGAILSGMRQYSQAESILRRAQLLAPHNGQINAALARLYLATQRPDKARIEEQKARENGVRVFR